MLKNKLNYQTTSTNDFIQLIKTKKKINIDTEKKLLSNIIDVQVATIDNSNLINNLNDNTSLSLIIINLKSIYKVDQIIKVFNNLFGSKDPIIINFHSKYKNYYMFNIQYLNNEWLNKIINKKNLIIGPFSNVEPSNAFKISNLLNDSVKNLFNDLIYKIIYYEILKIQLPFKRFISYELLYSYSKITNLEKKKNILKNKTKKEININNKVELNKELKQVSNNIDEIKNKFKIEYNKII